MQIGNLNLSGRLFLAPLAGVSHRPFRRLAIRSGAALCFSEMVSADALVRRQSRTLAMATFQNDEQPIGIQLFGSSPEIMGQAAALVGEQFKPDLIDINFGCPVKKVVRKNGGAALLKDLPLAKEIMIAVVKMAGQIPVTIKMRSGWDESSKVYLELARAAEQAGVAAVTLHARTRSGGYSGQADWSSIRLLKQELAIPVIGNGDVASPADAERMFEETGCDGVMIGRAAMADPLIFARVSNFLDNGIDPGEPSRRQMREVALELAGMMIEEFGETKGMRMMRRHLGWMVRGFPGAAQVRPRLQTVCSVSEIREILAEIEPSIPLDD